MIKHGGLVMVFVKRRAYFEFLGKTTLEITTFLNQKKFYLTEECTVDLVTLKKVPHVSWPVMEPPSNFFVVFNYDSEEDNYFGEVYAQVEKDMVDCVAIVDWKEENRKNVQVTVSADD
jgi:hypothetical protein